LLKLEHHRVGREGDDPHCFAIFFLVVPLNRRRNLGKVRDGGDAGSFFSDANRRQ